MANMGFLVPTLMQRCLFFIFLISILKLMEEDHMPSYVWRCPGRPLIERRKRAERRREELLHIFYQGNVITDVTDRLEDLVREWVALLVERDQLLREQVHQENRVKYFTDLQELLREKPSLGEGSEEVMIKETLMNLERCVSRYCMRKAIGVSPKPLLWSDMLSKPLCYLTPPPLPTPNPTITNGFTQQELKFYEQKGHLRDLETGQTGIDVVRSSEKYYSGSSGSLFNEAKIEVPALIHRPHVPIADQLGKEHLHEDNLPSTSYDTRKPLASNHSSPNSLPVESLPHIPPVTLVSPPPLPVTPPLNLTLLQPSSIMGKYGQRGVAGTVQFAGMSFANSACEPVERSKAASIGGREWEKETITEDDKEQVDLAGGGNGQGDESSLSRKNLMMEISSVGQTALKRTNCPRSPSGTPIKKSFMSDVGDNIIMTLSTNQTQHHSNSDMLQIALLAKFRSLYSTPFGQRLNFQQNECSNSFDFSSAWSDINSSVQICDDPGINNTSTFLSGFSPGQK